uniref:Uncharacterized protein n=1 Tax=Arundo donax TaxID=35708 RepID=A0A0A8Y5Y1_ARUDO
MYQGKGGGARPMRRHKRRQPRQTMRRAKWSAKLR